MRYNSDTIATISTAVSPAGIGIIRISGPDAMDVLGRVFEPAGNHIKADQLESHRIYYGNVVDQGEIIDECIVLIMKAPRSYTREDVVEIDCHGGVSVVYRIMNLVCKCGARPAEPGEFTKRAFLNGRIDLSQAEAVMDLIEAKNENARKNSVSQLKGKLSETIRKLRENILYEIAFIESALDDPEHYSLEGYPECLKVKVDEWKSAISDMISSYDNGRMIREGIRTCIVGKPNAGKSSILNALLGEERAIVTDIAGTTRDTLEELLSIEGITLNIIDTAGIRETSDQIEKIGVKKAKKEIERADLILFVIDSSVALTQEDRDIFDSIKGKRKIILLNKSDMTPVTDIRDIERYSEEDDRLVSVSAKYHTGIEDFIKELKDLMFHGKIDMDQEIYITNVRHKNLLVQSLESIKCLDVSLEEGMPEDFFTIDMMDAYESLGMIIGQAVEDDLVDEIFSRFCMGK